MDHYNVMYHEDKFCSSLKLRCPKRLPTAGDVFVSKIHFYTVGNKEYVPGDEFMIVERTMETPHHRLSSLLNLKIKCKHHTSIWTCFDAAVADGWLTLKNDTY